VLGSSSDVQPCRVAVSMHIRELDEPTHRELVRRADAAGMSLRAYVVEVLRRHVALPTSEEWLDEVRGARRCRVKGRTASPWSRRAGRTSTWRERTAGRGRRGRLVDPRRYRWNARDTGGEDRGPVQLSVTHGPRRAARQGVTAGRWAAPRPCPERNAASGTLRTGSLHLHLRGGGERRPQPVPTWIAA
jgi:plasmid stability protein